MKIDPHLKKRLKRHLEEQLRRESNQEIVIETPYALSEREVLWIKQALQTDGGLVQNRVNKSLLGGCIIRRGSKKIDASVGGNLAAIVSRLTQSQHL